VSRSVGLAALTDMAIRRRGLKIIPIVVGLIAAAFG
jgi:hypothetical protein